MPSTPLICCSSGAATVSAITFGLAPGYAARTTTVGGTTAGYSLTGNRNSARPPAATISNEMTMAKIGRSMKKRENFMASSLPARAGVALRRGGPADNRRGPDAFVHGDEDR